MPARPGPCPAGGVGVQLPVSGLTRFPEQRLDLAEQAGQLDRLGVVVVAAASSAFSRSPDIAWAVSAMTGIACGGPDRPSAAASPPSRRCTGRLMSIRIRSGASDRAIATPCRAVDGQHDLVALALADAARACRGSSRCLRPAGSSASGFPTWVIRLCAVRSRRRRGRGLRGGVRPGGSDLSEGPFPRSR